MYVDPTFFPKQSRKLTEKEKRKALNNKLRKLAKEFSKLHNGDEKEAFMEMKRLLQDELGY